MLQKSKMHRYKIRAVILCFGLIYSYLDSYLGSNLDSNLGSNLGSSAAWAFKPVAYVAAPKPKAEGVYAKNYKLRESSLIAEGKMRGPEDIAIDESGNIYAGSSNGKVYKISTTADGATKVDLFADPKGGMTLGLMFTKTGELIACNCPQGLLSISKTGEVSCLTKTADNENIGYPDDLDIAADGKIYFSSATMQRKKLNGFNLMFADLLESHPYGKLLVYDPVAKTTTTLLKDLYFANGVALSPDADFVLVNETYRYRVRRYWLKGPKAGTTDIFSDNLPGMTDGINRDPGGGYWVSVVVPRTDYMDYVQARPKLKQFFSHISQLFWGRIPHYGMVLKIDKSGAVVENLQDPTGRVWSVTNAVRWKDYLYLGSLKGNAIARYQLEH